MRQGELRGGRCGRRCDEPDDDTTYTAGSGLMLSGTTFSVRTNGISSGHIAPNAVRTDELSIPHYWANGSVVMDTAQSYYDVSTVNLSLSSTARCTFWLTGTINGLDGNEPSAAGYFFVNGPGMPSSGDSNRAIVGRPYGTNTSYGTTGTIVLTTIVTAGLRTYRCRLWPMASWATYLRNDQLNCELTILCT